MKYDKVKKQYEMHMAIERLLRTNPLPLNPAARKILNNKNLVGLREMFFSFSDDILHKWAGLRNQYLHERREID